MTCQIIRNNETNQIERVLAPNGKDSILFKTALEISNGDKELASKIWGMAYTNSFKTWFGDWENKTTVEQPETKSGVAELFESNPELANAVYEALVPQGYTRLYRSEDDNTQDKPAPDWVKESDEYKAGEEAKGRWFYKTLNEAIEHSKKFGSKGISYIDIPTNLVNSFNAKDNKFAGGYGKEGKEYFVSKELADNRKSFEQQKQQAQQLYSQYLDTIFPDSKVKDIVYRSQAEKGNETRIHRGIYFSIDKNYSNVYGKTYKVPTKEFLVNLKNPKNLFVPHKKSVKYKENNIDGKELDFQNLSKDDVNLLKNNTYDSVIVTEEEFKELNIKETVGKEIIVFEPEQIHILGSEKDKQLFSDFVKIKDFTNSKVLDENGEPLILYHWSPVRGINVFNLAGIGSHFGTYEAADEVNKYKNGTTLDFFDYETGEGFPVDVPKEDGEFYPVFLNLRNPALIIDKGQHTDEKDGDEARELLSKGHDGFYYTNEYEDKGSISYVAVRENQIKSVFNNGDFSFIQDNINYQISSLAQRLDIKRPKLVSWEERISQEQGERNHFIPILNKLKAKFGIDWKEDNTQSSVGRYSNGTVYINFNKIKTDTVFHEFSHPFEQAVKKQNPILWKSLASRVKTAKHGSTNIFEFVKQKYPELTGDDLISEAIVTTLGLYASEPEKMSNINDVLSIKAFMNKIWKVIQSLFSEKEISVTDERLIHLTFGQLSKLLFSDNNKINFNIENDNKTWFQKSENSFAALKTLQSKMTLEESTHVYKVDGKAIKDSVHSKIIKPYYDKVFGQKRKTESQTLYYDTLKEIGKGLHKVMENIYERYVDPATGKLRDKPLSGGMPNNAIYQNMENYFVSLVEQFKDDNPRFMSEVRLYDSQKDLAGTVDFLVLTDSGMHVYDWKSIQTRKGQMKVDDIQFYKEEAYRLQLSEYKKMLEKITGDKVVYAAAIPFEANTNVTIVNKSVVGSSIYEFNIGDIDPRKIPSDKPYLVPIVLKDQKTGDALLDKMISKLNGMLDTVNQQVIRGDLEKREQRNALSSKLRSVIRSLQVKFNVGNFKDASELYIRQVKHKLKDPKISKSELLDMLKMLEIFRDSNSLLRNVLGGTDIDLNDPETYQNYSDILVISGEANNLITDVNIKITQLAEKISNSVGIVNIDTPQKALDVLKSTFRSISTMPIKTVQVIWKLLVEKQNIRDVDTRNLFEELKELKDKLSKWASNNGSSLEKELDKLQDKDKNGKATGSFLRKYSKEFRDLKRKAIKDGDEAGKKWLLENTDFDYEGFEKYIKEKTEYIESQTFSTDVTKDKKEKERLILNEYRKYGVFIKMDNNVITNEEALFNHNNRFIKPKDKFITKEWKELEKNEILFDVYKKFQNIINEGRKLGMFENHNEYRFIPNLETKRVEKLAAGDVSGAFDYKTLIDHLEANSGQGFAKLEALTGEEMKTIPVYFTKDLVKYDEDGNVIDNSRKSRDLFKVFAVFGAHVLDYKMKSDLEDDANIMLEVEKNKKTYQTNFRGHVKKDAYGNTVEIEGKGETSNTYKVLQDFVDFYVYGKAGRSQEVTFKLFGKELSGRKVLNSFTSYLSLKTLSFNVPSAMANLFGGKANAFFEASKKINFDEKGWLKASYKLGSADKKAWALVNYFNILLEDNRREGANELSIYQSSKILNNNNLMALQRKGDVAIQYPTALAMMESHMLDDKGEIVNIVKYVRSKNGYEGVYNRMTIAEKKELDNKISKEVEELKKTKSLEAIAKFENGKISIPGLDNKSATFAKFRSKIKKVNKGILGNSTTEDITRARLSALGQVYMQFRNWMPQMITERFGDYTYDTDLERVTFGKSRLFFKELFTKNIGIIAKDLIMGIGSGMIGVAKTRYLELKEEMILSGEDFDISETEYIDLYIAAIRSQMRELMVILAGGVMFLSAFSGDGDDDKDGWKKMVRRTTKRLLTELTFYYSPDSVTSLVKSPFPVIKLLTDIQNFAYDLTENTLGTIIGNEKWTDEAKPAKYFFNIFPVTKEAIMWWAMLDDEFRIENEIKISN